MILLNNEEIEKMYEFGYQLFMEDDFEGCISIFQDVIAADPRHAPAYNYMGLAYFFPERNEPTGE